jgi:hypothetical protein
MCADISKNGAEWNSLIDGIAAIHPPAVDGADKYGQQHND